MVHSTEIFRILKKNVMFPICHAADSLPFLKWEKNDFKGKIKFLSAVITSQIKFIAIKQEKQFNLSCGFNIVMEKVF